MKIAKHASTGQYAAIKIVPKSALTSRMSLSGENAEKMMQAIEREIVIVRPPILFVATCRAPSRVVDEVGRSPERPQSL